MLTTADLIDSIINVNNPITNIQTDMYHGGILTLSVNIGPTQLDFANVDWTILAAVTYFNDSHAARKKFKNFLANELMFEVEVTGDNGGIEVTDDNGTPTLNKFCELLDMTVTELVSELSPG